MIRNLTLTAHFFAKTLAAQQRSVDFLGKVVLDNRLIFRPSKNVSVVWTTRHVPGSLLPVVPGLLFLEYNAGF